MINKRKLLTTLTLLPILFAQASAQSELPQAEEHSKRIDIYFEQGEHTINREFQSNDQTTSELLDILRGDETIKLTKVEINSYTSPEGGRNLNIKLAERRSQSLYDFIISTNLVPEEIISTNSHGIDWDMLINEVESSSVPNKSQVIETIRNTPEEVWTRVNPQDKWLTLVDSRTKHLMEIESGNPYRYMSENIFPRLRRGSIVTVYFKYVAPSIAEEVTKPTPPAEAATSICDDEVTAAAEDDSEEQGEQRSLKFALKTNLLYDLLLTPNIELEIPIGDWWSVTGEWIFPWWVTKNNGYALQILSGQLEGRYWFGDRAIKPQLTGWFAGFYAGGGLYDLQWKNNGYQGEFYIAAGLSGGYAHTINRSGSLRMEYSLGVGYMKTDYSYYEGKEDNEFLVWQHDGRYTWIGPTKAEVSLVWFIDWKIGGER